MNIKEIERQIVVKVLNYHQDFEKAVLSIFNYTFTKITGFSFPLQYFKDNMVLDLPTNYSISSDIGILLNLMFKNGTKTNKCTFTIYPSGEYESAFIWDESLEQERLLKSIRSHFTWLFIHSVYKIEDVFLPEQEWGTAILTMEFKDGKIQPLQITILFEGKMLHFSCGIENIGLSEDYSLAHNIKTYEDMYQLANQVDIKDKLFGSWTKVTITLKQNSTGDEMNWKNYVFE